MLGDLRGEVIKPLLCVHQLKNLNLGHDVWFTNAFFEISQDRRISYSFYPEQCSRQISCCVTERD